MYGLAKIIDLQLGSSSAYLRIDRVAGMDVRVDLGVRHGHEEGRGHVLVVGRELTAPLMVTRVGLRDNT